MGNTNSSASRTQRNRPPKRYANKQAQNATQVDDKTNEF